MAASADKRQRLSFRRATVTYLSRTSASGGLVIGLLLAWLFWYGVLKPWRESQDLKGIPYRSEAGIITSTTVAASRSGMGNANAFVQINGIVVFGKAEMPVHAGQKVLITYRVGNSGAIYVDSIDPLSRNQ